MAKKVILKDLNGVEILPITRGELVLDSFGNLALHSNLFLATDSLPGLLSPEDKYKLDHLEDSNPGADTKVAQINTTTNDVYRLLFSETADDEDRTESSRKSANLTFNPSTGNVTAITFTGNLIGNALTATTASKLSTVSKKAWGLTYWTSEGIPTDISGDMTGVGNISINASGNKDYFINFLYNTTPTYSWRLGYLGSGSGNANYFVIDSSKSSGGTWHRVLLLGNEDLNATFSGQVLAPNFISGDGVNDFSEGTVKLDILNIPTTNGGTTFGPGSNGQVLKSNGTTVYWGSDNNSNITISDPGTGNAITGLSASGHTITVTKGNFASVGSVTFTPASGELTPSDVLGITGGWSIRKGKWSYADNGYIVAGNFGNIDLAGTSVLTFGNSSAYTQLYITAPSQSGHSGKTNEIFFYNNHGADYHPDWTRVITNRNYTDYVNTTNFPGLNKVGTITEVVAGAGLSGGGTSGKVTLTNAGVRSVTIGTGSNSNKVAVNTNGTTDYLTIPFATTAKSLSNYYSSRPTTIEPGVTGDGSMFQFKCTSSVTDTTTDPGDGHILHFNWDNNGKWDSQIYLNCGGVTLKTRGMNGSGWNPWVTYLNTSNYTSYLGYIGTTAVQSSSVALALTGITTATFSGAVTLSGTTFDTAILKFSRSGASTLNYIIWPGNSNSDCKLAFGYSNSSSACYYYMTNTSFNPVADNVRALGTSSARWSNVYSYLGNFVGDVTLVSSSGDSPKLRFVRGGSVGDSGGLWDWLMYSSSGHFYLQTDLGSNSWTTPFFINTSLNVGIGKVDPSYKLDVINNARIASIVMEVNDEINRYGGALFLLHRGTIEGSLGTARTGNIYMCANGGNVGIGAASASYKLHVNGQIYSTGYVRSGSSDSYVLLGGGGHKSISSFQTTYDERYVLKSGDTMTGTLTLYSASGDSPHLYFLRGTTTDSTYDWDMFVTGGSFTLRQNNAGTWNTALTAADNYMSTGWRFNVGKELSVKDQRFNYGLAYYNTSTSTVTGTIVITLPNGWTNAMNTYEIDIYEYIGYSEAADNVLHSKLIIDGYNYSGSSAWINYGYTQIGSYNKGVRLGYNGSKCVIMLGTTSTKWYYPQVHLSRVITGFSNLTSWSTGYSISVITSESGYSAIVTANRLRQIFADVVANTFRGNLVGNATSATQVIVNLHTANDTEYPMVWSNSTSTSTTTGNLLYKSYSHLTYNPSNHRISTGLYIANNSAGPHFTGNSTSGNWAYLRLHNSTCYWDIATNNSSSTGSGGLWLSRYNGGGDGIFVSTGIKVGISTSSPSYKFHVVGDTYTSGWSRAASGFYVLDKGVHFSNNGTTNYGEIACTSGNEFMWGASTSSLFFNYRAASRGTTVTSYTWNAGSSSTYASHTLGKLYIKDVTLSTTLPTYSNAPVQFKVTYNNNDASNARYQPWISGKDSVNSYGYEVTVSTGIYRDPGYSNGGYYIGCGWDGNANSCLWKFSRNGILYGAGGFAKNGSSDSYVLLGGGGHKALSDFSMAHSHSYHPLGGSWKPSSLSSYTRHWGWAYSSAEAGLASDGGAMQIYTDGKFWQREGAYYCLDNGNTYVSSGTGVINGSTITYVSTAGTANASYYVYDYNATTTPIYIGYAGAALSTATHFAAYGTTSSGARCIKDIPVATVKSLLGIPTVSSRSLTVNGTAYTFYSNTTTAAASFYAPTSVGSSYQILVSSGSTSYPTPYWENRMTSTFPGIIWMGYIYRSTRSSTYWYASREGGYATVSMAISLPTSSNNYLVALQSSTHTILGGICSIQAQWNAGKDGGQSTEGPLYAYSTVDVSKIEEAGPDVFVTSVYGGKFYIKAMRASDANNSSYYLDGLAFTGAGKDTNSLPLARINVILFGY